MYNQGYRPPQAPEGQASQWYAPPPEKGSKKREAKPQPKKKRSWKWQLVKLALVLVLLGGACAGLFVWKTQGEVRPYMSVFLDNVSVDGIDLSGKTFQEGEQLVRAQIAQKQNGWYVRLRNARGDANDITAQTLGISFDPAAALQQAWAVGHSGNKNIFDRQKEIAAARESEHAFSSAQQSADVSRIDSILATLEKAAYRGAVDAAFLGFNPDDANTPFAYQPEVYGRKLNTTAIRARILEMVQNLESGEILLETETLYPAVTVADLQQNHTLLSRAVTPISADSSEDRTQNIRIAFAKINGMVLESGKKFSFNTVVGRRNIDNGFLPAIEYAYGLEQWGWGGGVCQASSTVYIAAAESGMTILEREPHSMGVSYTGYGLDATVSDTRGREIDFRFRNESGSPIYIAAHVIQSPNNKKKLMCEVRIYGKALSDGISYKLETTAPVVVPKPDIPIEKVDKNHDYVTYFDETKTIKGRDGYMVDTYLVTYQNGVAIANKKISSDYYKEKADTIYTGTELR